MTRVTKALSLALVAGSLFTAQAALAADPIKVGIVGPVTGPAANTGLTVQAAWQLVVDRYNADGGIAIDREKRLIELVPADSQSKASVGVSAAQRLLMRDRVDILVGDTLHSDISLGIMEVASATPDTLFYVPLPTSTNIGDKVRDNPGKYGNTWKWDADSTAYGVSVGSFMTSEMSQQNPAFQNKTYAIVAEASDYSATIGKQVMAQLEGSDWKLVTTENAPIGSTDFYTQISKIKALAPDIVISIFTTANSGLAYVKQAQEQGVGYEDVGIYYPGLPAFMEGVGPQGNGLIFFSATFDPRSERGAAFVKTMTEGDVPATADSVLGYCSAELLFATVAKAGKLDATSLGDVFEATDDDTCPTYQRIVFDPARHAPLLGPDHSFITGSQMFADGKDYFVFYPPRAATRALNDFPAGN